MRQGAAGLAGAARWARRASGVIAATPAALAVLATVAVPAALMVPAAENAQCQRAITTALESGTQLVNAKLRDVDGGALRDPHSLAPWWRFARLRAAAPLRPPTVVYIQAARADLQGQHSNQLLFTAINARFAHDADSGVIRRVFISATSSPCEARSPLTSSVHRHQCPLRRSVPNAAL